MIDQRQKLILIVNNDPDAGIRLSKQLDHEGYATDITWSGVEALRWLATNSFDLLLVDEYVADIYVEEFLTRASQTPGHPPILVTKGFPPKNAAAEGSRFRGYKTVYRDGPGLPSAISLALNGSARLAQFPLDIGRFNPSIN